MPSGVADRRGAYRDPDHPSVLADQPLLDRIDAKVAADLPLKGGLVRINVVGMGMREQSDSDHLIAGKARERAHRLIDAQQPAVGVDLADADGSMLVGGSKPLLLLAQLAAAVLQ